MLLPLACRASLAAQAPMTSFWHAGRRREVRVARGGTSSAAPICVPLLHPARGRPRTASDARARPVESALLLKVERTGGALETCAPAWQLGARELRTRFESRRRRRARCSRVAPMGAARRGSRRDGAPRAQRAASRAPRGGSAGRPAGVRAGTWRRHGRDMAGTGAGLRGGAGRAAPALDRAGGARPARESVQQPASHPATARRWARVGGRRACVRARGRHRRRAAEAARGSGARGGSMVGPM